LNAVAGDRPAVRMLLDNLPAAQSEVAGLTAPVTVGGPTVQIPLGTLTGTSHIVFNAWQASGRVDHRLNGRHTIGSRYLLDDSLNSGDGQVSPPNLTTVTPLRRQSATTFLNSVVSPSSYNELRVSYHRTTSNNTASNPNSGLIPSVEVNELGLIGFQDGPARTGIGLAGYPSQDEQIQHVPAAGDHCTRARSTLAEIWSRSQPPRHSTAFCRNASRPPGL